MKTHKVYITVLDDYIEVSDAGRFELPAKDYSSSELKKIARDVNKAVRESSVNFGDTQEDE